MSGNLLIHVFRSSIIDLHGFPSQACTVWFSAVICKHVRFSLHAANMCDFLLQREQDTMLPLILSHPMFLREIGSRQTKKRAALSFCLCWQDWLEDNFFSFQCISDKTFLQIRINLPAGNHPSQTFLANQDQSPRWKSSLTDFSNKSGCISSLEIIPHRHFLLIRMNFLAENHPPQTFLANQDEFPRWKSSPTGISCKSGCIPSLEIIPLRHFLLIRMHFPVENHPSQTFPANQDAFPRWKSSLSDISC